MTDDDAADAIRRAIGGDHRAITWVVSHADSDGDAVLSVMAALLEHDASRLDQARRVAASSRDRQVVEIAHAHLSGDRDRVDALARDHLADHPASLIVAWIAGDARDAGRRPDRS